MKADTVAAVLERLGVAPPSRDLAGLQAVYAPWCRGVSFDNVLKMIHVAEARPGPLPGSTAESFFEVWLACGAGGTCWAGDGALHGLLEALGFDAKRAIATMMPSQSPANRSSSNRSPGIVWHGGQSTVLTNPFPRGFRARVALRAWLGQSSLDDIAEPKGLAIRTA